MNLIQDATNHSIGLSVRKAQVERYTYLVTEPGRSTAQQARVEAWLQESIDDLAAYEAKHGAEVAR